MNRRDEGLRIVAFYENSAPDDRGRFLDEILYFDDDALEYLHDYIQWLFPMRERSGANPTAPRLDNDAIEEFHTRSDLQIALRRSFDRMLAFYGLKWDAERIVRSNFFDNRNQWLTPGNHNHLRLTRILTAMRLLGDAPAASALFRSLEELEAEERKNGTNRISDRSFRFWADAARG